jgi:hypothetical protein
VAVNQETKTILQDFARFGHFPYQTWPRDPFEGKLNKANQSKAKESKAKESKAKQSKSKQS